MFSVCFFFKSGLMNNLFIINGIKIFGLFKLIGVDL